MSQSPYYCGAPTTDGTRRYDPSGHCRRKVAHEGELCRYHQLQLARLEPADRHE